MAFQGDGTPPPDVKVGEVHVELSLNSLALFFEMKQGHETKSLTYFHSHPSMSSK